MLGHLAPSSAVSQRTPVRASPEVVIPGDGQGYSMTRVAGIVELRDGGVALLLPVERQLLLFGPKGDLRRTVGRSGSGPGEFDAPRLLGARRDSLWVWDAAQSRISLFAPDGGFKRTIPVVSAGAGILLDNGQVAIVPLPRYPVTGDASQLIVVRTYTNRGVLRDSILSRRVRREVLRYIRGNGAVVGMQPFDDGELIVPAGDGTGIAVITRAVRPSPPHAYRIEFISPSGRTIYSRTIAYDPRPLTRAHVQEAIRPLLAGPDSSDPSLPERVEHALYKPRHLPPVTAAIVGQDGSLWVKRETSVDSAVIWDVHDKAGVSRHALSLPAACTLLAATASRVWCVQPDDDGVPKVIGYRIRQAQ